MRVTSEFESKEVGELPEGATVTILQQRVLRDGTKRARIALVSQSGQLRRGWVSEVGRDGTENLMPMQPAIESGGADDAAAAPLARGDGEAAAAEAVDAWGRPNRPQEYEVGTMVYLPRSRGQHEGVGYVIEYDALRRMYVVEVDAMGSGLHKQCTADFLSAESMGAEHWQKLCARAQPIGSGAASAPADECPTGA